MGRNNHNVTITSEEGVGTGLVMLSENRGWFRGGEELGKDAGVKGQVGSESAEVQSWGKQSGRMLLGGVSGAGT